MTIIGNLASWIAYALIGLRTGEALAATSAALAAIVVIGLAHRSGKAPAQLVLEYSTAAFFVLYAGTCWALGSPDGISHWVGAASQCWLAATVAVGLAVGRPFTQPIAERQVPEEVRRTAAFRRFNIRITTAWLIGFTCAAAILVASAAAGWSPTWLNIACIVTAIAGPTLYTRRLIARSAAT